MIRLTTSQLTFSNSLSRWRTSDTIEKIRSISERSEEIEQFIYRLDTLIDPNFVSNRTVSFEDGSLWIVWPRIVAVRAVDSFGKLQLITPTKTQIVGTDDAIELIRKLI